jgi:hypothetical protein
MQFPNFKANHFFNLGCYLNRDNMFVLKIERQTYQRAKFSDQIKLDEIWLLLLLANQNIKEELFIQ